MQLWYIRILFLAMCTVGGYAISQVRPEFVTNGFLGAVIGFGFGGFLIAIDEMLKGFSLRAFSATTFGLFLGSISALLIDHSGLFEHTPEDPRWLIRLVVPRFVLKELQQIGDSNDPVRRARGRRGLEMLNRLQRNTSAEVRIHDGDFPEEKEVDAKLVRLARNLGAKLFTNDYNLGKIAALQNVNCVNIHEVAKAFKTVLIPGETLNLKIIREGKDKGQGVGYLVDGTMVVVNHAHELIGQQVDVQVQSLLQTGAGVIVFADLKPIPASS